MPGARARVGRTVGLHGNGRDFRSELEYQIALASGLHFVVIMAIHAVPMPGLVVLSLKEGGMDEAQFSGLLDRARGGDSAAVADLLGAFEADLKLIVRAKLPRFMRSRFDSQDFLQAVWKSVFAGDSELGEFDNSTHFRKFIAGVARNKILAEQRHATTRKVAIRREEPLYVRTGDHDSPREIAGCDPTPSKFAQADECMGILLDAASAEDAEIVRLRRKQMTFDEIANQTGRSERSVRRTIEAAWRRIRG